MKITLEQGREYDVYAMLSRFAGWTVGDGSGADGYHVLDYFDLIGRYMGPDLHGIEPLFDDEVVTVT